MLLIVRFHCHLCALQNDVIARASLANLEQLRKEVEECGWEGRVQEMVESKEFRLRAGIGVGILMGGPMALGAWALVASEALPDDIKKRASVAIQKFVDENNVRMLLRLFTLPRLTVVIKTPELS